MYTIWIKLNTIQKLKEFVADCAAIDLDLEVAVGEHMANAKSLLGLMTLPLSGPLMLRANCENEGQFELLNGLAKYEI